MKDSGYHYLVSLVELQAKPETKLDRSRPELEGFGRIVMNANFWKFVMFTAATALVLTMLPDIKRYVRISSM
jgi:hypothetical protein